MYRDGSGATIPGAWLAVELRHIQRENLVCNCLHTVHTTASASQVGYTVPAFYEFSINVTMDSNTPFYGFDSYNRICFMTLSFAHFPVYTPP